MSFVPVTACTRIDDQRHGQAGRCRHQLDHLAGELLDITVGDFENELIVHLHDHARINRAFCQPARNSEHRALDDIGCCALHGRIDRAAFCVLARRCIA